MKYNTLLETLKNSNIDIPTRISSTCNNFETSKTLVKAEKNEEVFINPLVIGKQFKKNVHKCLLKNKKR